MSGAVVGGNIAVVRGPLCGVAHEHGDGGACSPILKYAGQNLHTVGFLSLCRIAGGTGFSPVEKCLDILRTKLQPGRAAVYDNADASSVGFPPGSDLKNRSKC